MNRKTIAILASSLLALGAASAAHSETAPATATAPAYGSFGFDTNGMDKTVDPADDFYKFANGSWEKATQIPSDRSNFGMFTVLDDLSQKRTREIIDEAQKQKGSKIGDLYASFMDEAAAEKLGMKPLKPVLARVNAVKNASGFARLMGQLALDGLFIGPFAGFVQQDDKHPENYIVALGQSGLGLPDRDYYLKDDEAIAKTRTAYAEYLAKLLTLAGESNAKARADAIVAFETRLARVQWSRVDSRDSDKTYNKWSRADFDTKAAGFDWQALFTAIGVQKQPDFIVAQPSAFTESAKIVKDTPVALLRDYAKVHVISDLAPYLNKEFADAEFGFNSKTLNGIPENRPRWKRGVELVKGALGEAVGQQYVAKYFPPEAKQEADRLVKNVIAAMDRRLAALEWMSPETKVAARAKLAAFTPKIGYPDKWRDYSSLVVKRNDLVGNVLRANQFELRRNLAKLGKPIDRSEWFMTPMEVNAYANPVMNEIVFPAAILQAPFFDPKADPAVNYGGIGAVIGHEISHHFDDQGRKYDKNGALTDWWTAEDVKRFTALTDKLVKQYDAYEALPGQRVNGSLTLGENIADLAGLTVAHEAWTMSLDGKPAPVMDGFTGEQRFYLGWAQIWRRSYREANLRQRLVTDPHSPSVQRAAVVRNLDPWYDGFKPKTTGKLYLDPASRVRIW